MGFVFVVNPTAGRGRGTTVAEQIRRMLTTAGASFRIHESRDAAHARALAVKESERARVIVAVGGDGTVHHVARGIIDSGATAALGVIPAGTGNDFARAIGMPRGIDRSVRALLHGRIHTCDYGRFTCDAVEGTHSVIFLNAAGIGFDAYVVARRRQKAILSGVAGYATAAISALPAWESVATRVRVDEVDQEIFSAPLFLMSIGNGFATGGGFRLTPDADPCDGHLDACIVRRLPVWRALYLLPVAIAGRHIGAREVTMVRARELTVQCNRPLPLHADGELITESAESVSFSIVARGISVLFPSKSVAPETGSK